MAGRMVGVVCLSGGAGHGFKQQCHGEWLWRIERRGGGLAGTGDFAGFSRAVFGSDAAQFTTGEEEVRAEKRTVRYDYIVPRTSSGYVLRSGADSAVVDYAGSFWVDPATERAQ